MITATEKTNFEFVGQRMTGVISHVVADRGFAFLVMPGGFKGDLLLHAKECDCERLPTAGQRVSVEVGQDQRGRLRGIRAVIDT
jgi:cold shock CspA family protein